MKKSLSKILYKRLNTANNPVSPPPCGESYSWISMIA
jgi:hypothetical protein